MFISLSCYVIIIFTFCAAALVSDVDQSNARHIELKEEG
jgi:hypothetical protein